VARRWMEYPADRPQIRGVPDDYRPRSRADPERRQRTDRRRVTGHGPAGSAPAPGLHRGAEDSQGAGPGLEEPGCSASARTGIHRRPFSADNGRLTGHSPAVPAGARRVLARQRSGPIPSPVTVVNDATLRSYARDTRASNVLSCRCSRCRGSLFAGSASPFMSARQRCARAVNASRAQHLPGKQVPGAKAARAPGLQCTSTACQVKPTVRMKCPSLRCSTPPPAQCTMNASKMMARMATTTQKKNTMMPGMAYPATVLALATTASYPLPRMLFGAGTRRQFDDFQNHWAALAAVGTRADAELSRDLRRQILPRDPPIFREARCLAEPLRRITPPGCPCGPGPHRPASRPGAERPRHRRRRSASGRR
jgi:hypothetical protein